MSAPSDLGPAPVRRWSLVQRLLLAQFVLLASALFAALVLEIALRSQEDRPVEAAESAGSAGAADGAGETARGLYLPHPYLAYVQRPGAVRSSKEYSYRINNLGFRGADVDARKAPGTTRILCLGGSTTFGTGVRSDANTYPAALQDALGGLAPGRAFEVVNCGVSGYTSIECLIDLELRLVELEPDAILLYHGANDALVIQCREFATDYSHLRTAWVEHQTRGLDPWLSERSALWRWLATRAGGDTEKELNSRIYVEGWKQKLVPSTTWINQAGLRAFRRNVEHTIEIARAHGILPILSTFAVCRARPPHPSSDFFAVVEELNRIQVEVAGEAQVPILRIAESLPTPPANFDDWMHMNDQGSLSHGELGAAEMARLGLLGLKPR